MTDPVTDAAKPVTVPMFAQPPTLPKTLQVDADMTDDSIFRDFLARQTASQTLALQRTEWYVRSIRVYVALWVWLSLLGAVIAAIAWAVSRSTTGL